jgi:hypothetical protein
MPQTYATTTVRPGPQGNAFLSLEGKACGLIGNLSGGATYADVIEEKMGPSYLTKKHLGSVRYEEFSLDIGFAMAEPVFDWIAACWKRQDPRKDGAIIACDFNFEAKSERKFFNALITETTIPAMDANAKDPACLTLKFAPETVKTDKASGRVSGSNPKNLEKLFLPQNFKLEIEGLDCSKVLRIEPFTVKQAATHDEFASARTPAIEPGKLEFPDLKITFAEVNAQSWLDWFEDFVVKGNCDDEREKTGTLTLLSRDLKQTLASISFFNLGIFKIGHAHSGAAEKLKLATAEMYCEQMEFHFGK